MMCRELGQRANRCSTGDVVPVSVSIFPLVHGIGETERDVRGSWDRKIRVSGLKEQGTRKLERKRLLYLGTRPRQTVPNSWS